MQPATLFFLIFLGTVIVTRIVAQFRSAPTTFHFRTHHFMYGILLLAISILFRNAILGAIGLGLFLDETPLFGIHKWSRRKYDSPQSWLELGVFIVAVYFLRNLLISFF